MGGAEVDIWGISEFALLGKFAVESDFGSNFFAEHVSAEFGEITFTFGDGGEVFFKKFLAGTSAGGIPFVLVSKEEIFVLFPVTLDGSRIGGGSGGGAISVIALNEVAINYSDFAVIFFDKLVEQGVDAGAVFALIVRVIKDEDGGIWIAVDVFWEVARFFAGGEDLGEAIFGRGTINDTKTDDAGKNGDNDSNNNPSFLIHRDIITWSLAFVSRYPLDKC